MDDLKYLKKHYGENFAHLCRTLFPTILEEEGMLSKIISKNFAPTHSLYDAVKDRKVDFKNFIYSFFNVEQKELFEADVISPEELMDKAGYILYDECKTEDEIQDFRKYYAPNEELCTFWGDRLNDCRVWFAVKKNVDEIKRDDFFEPERQDEYGTSVISIQFTRSNPSTLSIKNRYNHSVNNPDATFGNNLDNIISGLTKAFVTKYNINLGTEYDRTFRLDNFVLANDGRFYKYHIDRITCYFCDNNVVIRYGDIECFDKDKYLLVDNYLINMQRKTIKRVDGPKYVNDGFTRTIGNIKSINITHEKGEKKVTIGVENGEDVVIFANDSNEMTGYINKNVTEIGDFFLLDNEKIKYIDMPNLTRVGNVFLFSNTELREISFPKLRVVGERFLCRNTDLKKADLPALTIVGDGFLDDNKKLSQLNAPLLSSVGRKFLCQNTALAELDLPSLLNTGDEFLSLNERLSKLNLPSLREAGSLFLQSNKSLKELNLPDLEVARYGFMYGNRDLEKLIVPELKVILDDFLANNRELNQLYAPKLESVKDNCFASNVKLKSLDLPKLRSVGDCFLKDNYILGELNAPSLIEIGNDFLCANETLTELDLPNLLYTGSSFLYFNNQLKKFRAPSLIRVGNAFMKHNEVLKECKTPNLSLIGTLFLYSMDKIKKLHLPKVVQKKALSQSRKSNKDCDEVL